MLNTLAEMTWRNPIFMLVLFSAIWFVPGLMIRRISKAKHEKAKAQKQLEKIQSLYPNK